MPFASTITIPSVLFAYAHMPTAAEPPVGLTFVRPPDTPTYKTSPATKL